MSWGHSATRSWKVIKYVDLRSQPSRIIMESDLAVNLCKESRLLTLSQGNTVIEQIPLCAPSPTVISQYTEFKQNDTRSLSSSQRSFYMLESQSSPHPDLRSVINPITIKREDFTNSPHNSQSPLKCFSPFSPMPSQSCLSTPVKLEVQEKATQTECLDDWCSSDEQLEAELSRLMRSPQFMSLVKKIQRIWPKLQMTGAGNGF
ncbi:unnamed protein product [Cylicocyclus nassatus]|uniref:Uncharacterized protein n=1 Tax=Cylicocyclus nassatus TaxID=53992 RepID=A0AA36GKX1_CYLNA|nr:unnamed protein product [Cylicocyclus nassatus]